MEFCATRIPAALGFAATCTVERAHCLGAPIAKRISPCPIITKYLNYSDKAAILQKFRQSGPLQIDGVKVLIFVDHSADVSKKQKAF